MNLFAKIRTFFSNPSYPRTLTLVGLLIIAVAIPVTVTVLSQTTHIFQFAAYTPGPGGGTCTVSDSYGCGACGGYAYADRTKLHTNSNCTTSCTNLGQIPGYCGVPACANRSQTGQCNNQEVCTKSWNTCSPNNITYTNCSYQNGQCGYVAPTNTPTPAPPKCPAGAPADARCTAPGTCAGLHGTNVGLCPNTNGTFICCAPPPTPTPTPAGTPCSQLGGVCVGAGNTYQVGALGVAQSTTYANTDCTGGALRQGTCAVPNTFCCPKNNVITTVDSGRSCTGPAPQYEQGTCWYNYVPGASGTSAYISNLPVITFAGMITLYNTTSGGNGICGQLASNSLPNGTPVACLGTGSSTANPSCSQGSAKGTCYTNNSCGDMKEIYPVPGTNDGQCTSPYRICCQPVTAPATPTPTSKPSGGGPGGSGSRPIACQNGQSTKVALSLKLPGIGSGNFENNAPKHGNRTAIYVSITDQNGNEVYPKNTAVSFNFMSGRFNSGTLDLGNNKLACGNTYTAHVKLATYLSATATVTYGSSQTLNIDLLPGDINKIDLVTKQIIGDGQISVLDYNFFRDNNCGKDVDPNKTIPFTDGSTTVDVTCSDLINFFDFPDGGTQGIEWADNYNIWLRSYIQANGYKI